MSDDSNAVRAATKTTTRPRVIGQIAGAALLVCVVAAACGDRDDAANVTASLAPQQPSVVVEGDADLAAAALDQPVVWPAPDVVLATPEEAAADFVEAALRVPANLGEFRPGDPRSGEIVVFSTPEPGGTPVERSVLQLRQLAPTEGWYVIGATSEGMSITSPDAGAAVAAAPLVVEGSGRGFEALVVVAAFPPGGADAAYDEVLTAGGSGATVEPFVATVDLGGAAEGAVVSLLARGGTGLETDPGEFAAIAVVVAGGELAETH